MRGFRVGATPSLPLVGRGDEWARIRTVLDGLGDGEGAALVLSGAEGSGRSRLCAAAREEAERRGCFVAAGSAFPLESGVPYGLFCDLLQPIVNELSPEARTALTRGAEEFGLLCPALASNDGAPLQGSSAGELADLKNRLLWNFPAFLDGLRKGRPAVFALEDVEWSDPSSLELLHFLVRRARELPLLLLVSVDPSRPGLDPAVRSGIEALVHRSGAHLLEPGPLSAEDVEEALSAGFGVSREVVGPLARALRGWTGGNPLFLTSTLEHLVAEGRLRRVGERWTGWNLTELETPGSLRGVILARLGPLTRTARGVADMCAVLGTRARFPVLRECMGIEDSELLAALDELGEMRILEEDAEGGEVVYRFRHPLVQELVHSELGLARSRLLHARAARVLERLLGSRALQRAEELAPHILHAGSEVNADEGARYLAAAGTQALRAFALREADRFLAGALELLPDDGTPDRDRERQRLLVERARALQRLGRMEEADQLLSDALGRARALEDPEEEARVFRRLGLGAFRGGNPQAALALWTEGLKAARQVGSTRLEARLRLACSACLQELTRHEDALEEARSALRIGNESADDVIRVSAHRTLLLLHTWSGPPGEARAHGAEALRLAEESGDTVTRFTVRWALAVLEGLTGNAEGVRAQLDHAWPMARELDAPILRLQLAEIEIEYAAGVGEWDRAADLAEESVQMARALNQRLMLPRLLVASGLFRLGRGELERAKAELDEAWDWVESDRDGGPAATHLSILVRSGRAALLSSLGEWEEAIRVAEEGLALADRGGYTAWGVYRLLPIIGEASMHVRDLERLARVTVRLRRDAERFEHRLADIWADVGDAMLAWLSGDVERGAERMAASAERLEAVASIPDAARLRRQLAGRLADLGDRDAAIRELRRVHDILAGLGARPELEKARGQFREVGARPPSRTGSAGSGLLSERELEIARLIGDRMSNKAIARELGISPRTVGTHLSNIFRKLEVDSRTRLGDLVREGSLDGA